MANLPLGNRLKVGDETQERRQSRAFSSGHPMTKTMSYLFILILFFFLNNITHISSHKMVAVPAAIASEFQFSEQNNAKYES